jgi:hypothetical protein
MKIKSRSQTNRPSETMNVVASRTERDNSGLGIRLSTSVSPKKMPLSTRVAVDRLMTSHAVEREMEDAPVPRLAAPAGRLPESIQRISRNTSRAPGSIPTLRIIGPSSNRLADSAPPRYDTRFFRSELHVLSGEASS